jgi:hypothetical protein
MEIIETALLDVVVDSDPAADGVAGRTDDFEEAGYRLGNVVVAGLGVGVDH